MVQVFTNNESTKSISFSGIRIVSKLHNDVEYVYGTGNEYSESVGKYPSIFWTYIHAIEKFIQFNIDIIMSDRQVPINKG